MWPGGAGGGGGGGGGGGKGRVGGMESTAVLRGSSLQPNLGTLSAK